MSDFRTELRERLAAVTARMHDELTEQPKRLAVIEAEHKKAMDALGRERAALEQLLALEDERAGVPALTRAQKVQTRVPLGDFLIAKVRAHGPMKKEELRATAGLAGYLVAEGSGRRFHATLMNINTGGRLTKLPDGRYACPESPVAMMFDADDDQQMEGEMQTLM